MLFKFNFILRLILNQFLVVIFRGHNITILDSLSMNIYIYYLSFIFRLVIEAKESKKSSVLFSPRLRRLKTKEKSKVNSNDLVDKITKRYNYLYLSIFTVHYDLIRAFE